VITSLLAADMADRAVISISPEVRGQGNGAVGELGKEVHAPPLRLTDRSVHRVGDTIIVAAEISRSGAG
jgi:riboflavin biosynthesis pyrimidine reductase